MAESTAPRPKVFISYSHKDEAWKDRLLGHLEVAAREGDFEVWSDRRIQAGDEWRAEIDHALKSCELALLLVSTDFLRSRFIRDVEVPELLRRREKEGMRIFPVILKPCLWLETELSRFQARPIDGIPLSKRRGHTQEEEILKIAQEVWGFIKTSEPRTPSFQPFLTAYRQRLWSAFSRWDLGTTGVPQAGGAGRPIEAGLDEMYLPLRLAKGFELSQTGKGGPISPEDLLARVRPLAIRGSAGSGKTTWMEWTFRQLLRMSSAFPLVLIVRDVARKWHDPACQGAARSLDACIEDWIAAHGLDPDESLPMLLTSESGPKPVLLVDGWDEIGQLGEELRDKLVGFLREHPRVLAVVTSRPYDEGHPSHAEGFDVLDIQPLSDLEISSLARRFFQHCYGEEESVVEREAERLLRALQRSPDAQALARTALLLTMMLLISRARPLPDKRHLLYEACIENLLTALPHRREEEGAPLIWKQWRPDDSEERLRIVAALAAALQDAGYRKSTRSPIVGTWEDMARLLPEEWPEARREAFLAWLAGPAGLLTDRADGTLAFSHLSFQEFLTAWHLNATIEGAEQRIAAFGERLKDSDWWETLRLWAALILRQSRERLEAVLSSLTEQGGNSLVFTGTVLADGLGSEDRFTAWTGQFVARLEEEWSPGSSLCANAWSASRQDERREKLASALSSTTVESRWWPCLRLRMFTEEASLPTVLPHRLSSRILWNQLENEIAPASTPQPIAFGRILCGGVGIWPTEPRPVGLLQVWPGDRRQIGLRFQMAQTHGASRSELSTIAGGLLRRLEWTAEARDLARDLAREWARYLDRDLASDWARFLARDLARDSYDWAHGLARNLARYLAPDLARRWARYLARYWTRDWTRGWARDRALSWARDLSLDAQPVWFESFARGEILSLGRVQTRSILTSSEERAGIPEQQLLAEACRLSCNPGRDATGLGTLIERFHSDLDPLWPALARHIARLSTPEDRALLADLAQHPEKREPPLSWGLQFIVRGDVMMDDGSVVTLDELADEAGLPRLPYLEDMPDELEVDWDRV